MISPGRRAIVAVFYGPARKSQQTGSSFLCCHGEVVYVVASSERFFFSIPAKGATEEKTDVGISASENINPI